MLSGASLLAVFAHPDDETFRCGGTLALLARRGVRVKVLTATRGQAGSRGDPPLYSLAELPAVRENELRCACAALGLLPPILLDYQDGQLAEAYLEQLAAQILQVVNETHPQVMLTFGADGLSGHPDHIAIGLAAAEAFRRARDVSALYTLAVLRSLAHPFEWFEHVFISPLTRTWCVDELRALAEKAGLVDVTFHHRPGRKNGFMQ